MHEAVEMTVLVPALTDALVAHFASHGQADSFSAKGIAALRKQLGGHVMKPAEEQ